MKTIGQTVKMIRQIKGFTQSEVYSGVMSRSFAHRFENGENDISAAKLFKILDNLSISPNEFRFIQNDYQEPAATSLRRRLLRAYNGHDLQTMGRIIDETKKRSNLSYKSVAAMGQILVVTYYSKTFTVTPAMKNLWDTLFASKTWTLEEIRKAQILLPIAVSRHQEKLIPEIVERFENNCQKYLGAVDDPFHIADELMDLYLSLFQIDLNLAQYHSAKEILTKVSRLNTLDLSWAVRLQQQLITAIWELYFGGEKKGLALIAKLVAVENLYSPPVDHNLLAIINVRKRLAQQYRKANHTD
ncbi:DNA-binding protein [Lentilactobacillus parakefiri]|uniref:helix-turn-helix domain-containing protein n=1 Tax=Lentilactobacillus parakefiri TaxID=152332 RepID=UPI000BA73E4D|nr:helix-turn-helix transcriptional regulator [Lentilactobacillus parakefiri]PAL00169.1 DNA-binding protein [Lentilactobacillus parakefiri]